MYERMLNKNIKPTLKEMIDYCQSEKELITSLLDYLNNKELLQEIDFPYGNNYGWSFCYRKKKSLICNVFPEDNSFCVMLRLDNDKYNKVYNEVSDYTKEIIDNKYPCSDGGWIHYRVLNNSDLKDIIKLLEMKINK